MHSTQEPGAFVYGSWRDVATVHAPARQDTTRHRPLSLASLNAESHVPQNHLNIFGTGSVRACQKKNATPRSVVGTVAGCLKIWEQLIVQGTRSGTTSAQTGGDRWASNMFFPRFILVRRRTLHVSTMSEGSHKYQISCRSSRRRNTCVSLSVVFSDSADADYPTCAELEGHGCSYGSPCWRSFGRTR